MTTVKQHAANSGGHGTAALRNFREWPRSNGERQPRGRFEEPTQYGGVEVACRGWTGAKLELKSCMKPIQSAFLQGSKISCHRQRRLRTACWTAPKVPIKSRLR